jgi:hypothetical protein
MNRTLAALIVAIPLAAMAQPAVAPRTQAEIDHLFGYIAGSDCRFNRNGSWYDMAAARGHVTAKYEYLAAQGKIDTAESFIDQAAGASSMSGKQYLVQCANADPIPSAVWLRAELERYRQKR